MVTPERRNEAKLIFKTAQNLTIGISPEKPVEKPKKLTAFEDVAMTLESGISFNARIKLAKAIRRTGIDIFPSKRIFYQTKRKICRQIELEFTDGIMICRNAGMILQQRIDSIGGE